MAITKLIDTSKPVYTPNGDVYAEPKVDRTGRITLDNGSTKYNHQLEKSDTPLYVDRRIGDFITFVLDKTDEKATGETLRKRFFLSCRVEQSMRDNKLLEVTNEDIKLVEAALEVVKHPLISYRVQEALDLAEVKS